MVRWTGASLRRLAAALVSLLAILTAVGIATALILGAVL
jgi:hypothetical protein